MVKLARSSRQRALTAALAVALAAATATIPSAQADDLKHKKHTVERKISSAKSDLEDSSNQAVRARARLASARSQLGAAEQDLATTRTQLREAEALDAAMQSQLEQAQADLATARQRLADAQHKVREQTALLGRMASESMQQANPQLIGLWAVLKADSPADLSTQLKTVGNLMDREHTALVDLKEMRATMAETENKVQLAEQDVADKRQTAAANLVRRQQLENHAQVAKGTVAALVGTRRKAQVAAEAAKHADLRELAKLKRENNRIAAMLAARAHHSVSLGNNGPLLRPVTGYVTSPFGWRKHPIYGYWGLHDGTDFHAPCGTPLRAAGNGRVISEYPQTAWGNRLILDLGRVKGHGVSVIYNHISSYRVHTGATVTRGETVAYAGTTGWSTGCHLHFTVMVDGVAQNPMNWF